MDYEVKDLKKENIRLSDWEFEVQQRGGQPILLSDFFARAVNNYFAKYINGEAEAHSYLFTDSNKLNKHLQTSDKHYQEFVKRCEDKDYLNNVIHNTVAIPKAFNDRGREAIKELENMGEVDSKTLAKYWQELDQGFTKVIPWFWYPWILAKEDILTNRVKLGLEKHRKEIESLAQFDDAFLAVIFPIKKTSFQLEQEGMNDLVTLAQGEDFQNNDDFKVRAKEYLNDYDWLTTFILTPVLPMTFEQLVERVKKSKSENYTENFAKQKIENAKKEELAQRVIEVISGDDELMLDVSNAREIGYGLTAGIEEAYISTSRYLKLLQLVALRIGVAFEDTKYFLSKEIYHLLMNDKKADETLLNERKKGFALMMLDGVEYLAFGQEGHDISTWVDGQLNKVDETIKELKGQIACKGLVRGVVRVAFDPIQSHELKEGEILVCPMTNPDYVPAMKRSGAIVTDEGGLLSHAAIMSREFNKPCVIGTKIATKLLKTGDTIEVDADRGVVRRIS